MVKPMKTLKHYMMVFVILFSGGSSSWAGVSVAADQSGHQAGLHAGHSPEHGVSHSEHHDCCPPETTMPESVSQMQHADVCPQCGDECSCDSICHLFSPLATLKSHDYATSLVPQATFSAFISPFPKGSISQLERPPKAV